MMTMMHGQHGSVNRHHSHKTASATSQFSPSHATSVHLPITVYSFDRRTKKYALADCLQCAVPCATPPKVLTCNAGLGLLGENLELLKAAMQTPAVILQNGTRSKALNASGDEVVALPPTQR